MKKEEVQILEKNEIALSQENRLEIIDDGLRKKYLARLSEMPVVPMKYLPDLEMDLIRNVRMFQINEMVYQKGESVSDKLTTIYNALAIYNVSIFIVISSDGIKSEIYLGVRNNEADDSPNKKTTVILGETLRQTLIGHFPGAKTDLIDRKQIANLSAQIRSSTNLTAVSVTASQKIEGPQKNEEFVQGLEKMILAMSGKKYTAVILAENQSERTIQSLRRDLQKLYTDLSPLKSIQISQGTSTGKNRSQSFSEMDTNQKIALIGSGLMGVIGAAGGAALIPGAVGSIIGSQIGGQLGNFISLLAPAVQVSAQENTSQTSTFENREVIDILDQIDELLKKTREYDNYGLWNTAAYFLADDMATAEIAGTNYRSLMNGEHSGREVSAINTWLREGRDTRYFDELTQYLSRFLHPRFEYGGGILVDASKAISGKELGLHLGLPRSTVSGMPVIEHAEFGKEVTSYHLFPDGLTNSPEDRMTIGRIFDLGQITDKKVELNNKTLNMHTFITGSTGSGKSNAVYQMLSELRQDRIPFLVIEPAKGEYKDVFGHLRDVRVYSTNPNTAELLHLNPFMFLPSVHVLEHVDGLTEIFSVCWPMYDAMPAFFKDAILRSYEEMGWDLGSSTFEGENPEYPDFEILCEQLDKLIEESEYASDIKSNYRGALLTRVRSLTVGLNRYIFTQEQTPYSCLFDENCILDLSRVKSLETKSLLMGLIVYALNEYREDRKTSSNSSLQHITVLEEAHHLLKNTGVRDSELTGKSVEMITNTIAEIRTYGEGFIIVDQSPSSVDIAAIKNTNTKIVLRTPEANDRMAIGHSIGLSQEQVDEIAKLPSGVAVVYQNNWISPVLTMIDKANIREFPYQPVYWETIKTTRQARSELIEMLMSPWFRLSRLSAVELKKDVQILELKHLQRKELLSLIRSYGNLGGTLCWKKSELGLLSQLLQAVLGLRPSVVIELMENPEMLADMISRKTTGFTPDQIKSICFRFLPVEEESFIRL